LVEAEVVTQLEFVAPALGDLLGENIEGIVRARGPVTSFALLILIWSSSHIFNVLTRAMDRIWQVDVARSAWRHRGLAILLALLISGLLLAASFAEQTVLTIVNSLLPEEFEPLRPYTNQFWLALLSIVLFAVLYYFLPHINIDWSDVMPGAIGAGLLWGLAKQAFLFFVATYLSRSNLVYGSVATITAFLTWVYVSSMIFLFGAYLNVEYAHFRQGIEEKVVQQVAGQAPKLD
ncbi:MAG TPA: YihY/virulence factor BrkB family protein, partial [Anaerolineae bacterium]|nr:YihY/virulence factor BrkB family protein [Anaerolineae bacterium]